MDKKIIFGLLAVLIIATLGCTNNNGEEPLVCAADVKECADGSFVSRNPELGCDFNPCPSEDNGEEPLVCAADVKMCYDGTRVERNPENNCEFFECNELQECSAVDDCPDSMGCYNFEGNDFANCFHLSEDPCSVCESGLCTLAESYPVQVFCE